MPEKLADNLRGLIVRSGLSAAEVSRRCGIRPSTMSRILNREIETPRNSTTVALAEFFNVSPDELLGEPYYGAAPSSKAAVLRTEPVPVVAGNSLIATCMFGEIRSDDCNEWVNLPPGLEGRKGEICGWRAEGDAMSPRIRDGDLVFLEFSRDLRPANGSVVLAELPGENGETRLVLRRLVRMDGSDYFRADNPEAPGGLAKGRTAARAVAFTALL